MTTQTDFVPPRQASTRYAFFFDVDGTLAAIQPRPDEVFIPAAVRENLRRLAQRCEGAVALISGRPIAQLDDLVSPLVLPLAGVHGAERRDNAGNVTRTALDPDTASQLQHELTAAMATLPGTSLESKGMAFALHYRQAPQHQQAIEALAQSLVARFPALVTQAGKCVVELKPRGVNKGAAIDEFMQHPPFAGRLPVFIGDDLTDEAGFQAVNLLAGMSIKVGPGPSCAQANLQDVTAVYRWLEQACTASDDAISVSKESGL